VVFLGTVCVLSTFLPFPIVFLVFGFLLPVGGVAVVGVFRLCLVF